MTTKINLGTIAEQPAPQWIIGAANTKSGRKETEKYIEQGGLMMVEDVCGSASGVVLSHDDMGAGVSRSILLLPDDDGDYTYDYEGSLPEEIKVYRLPADWQVAYGEDDDE